MIVLGLTGSIGMGKSTTAEMFRALGVPVWDADAAVHALYNGGAAVPVIRELFPKAVKEGAVDRTQLRIILAGAPEGFAKLEAAVHPLIAEHRAKFLAAQDDAPLVVLDVPLLFETGLSQFVDKIAVVSVPYDIQRSRVLERATMDEAQFEQILARQMPDAEKRKKADYIIETRSHDKARMSVVSIIEELTNA